MFFESSRVRKSMKNRSISNRERTCKLRWFQTMNLERFLGGFGGHVGAEVGKFGPSMATRWHLKAIENDI